LFIPARTDNAVRASAALARAWPDLVKAGELSAREGLPLQFLENILADLRKGGLVCSRRGFHGGYGLARAPDQIALAEILTAVGSPLVVTGMPGAALERGQIGALWAELSTVMRDLLHARTLADLIVDAPPGDVDTASTRVRPRHDRIP
jgi:Rrf2 family protein